MNYDEVENWLCNDLPFFQNQGRIAYKENLENIIYLLNKIGNPQNNLKCIHVAGTNGKGSVSYMLSKLLKEENYRVGLFTSPHLLTFRERIQLNNEYIDKKSVIQFVKKYKSLSQFVNFSFFEFTTAMAFWFFNKNNIDIAIIECGLGGRLDSTNVIHPILSIITSISLDHANILGNNLISIANEKAGIIKKNTPVLISSQNNNDVINVFSERAKKLSSSIFYSKKIVNKYSNINLPNYQLFNIELVKSAKIILSQVGIKFSKNKSDKIIESYYKKNSFLGRWTIIQKKPLIICDIAHNIQGLKSVFHQLRKENKKKHIVLGFSSDKELIEIFKIININATFYFCACSNPRVLNPKKYFSLIQSINKNFFLFNNPIDAVKEIIDKHSDDEMVFVTGSAFIVADVLSIFR
ncbi:MAG: Mur ligase family protein [Bacteroidota bacterium]|nr:Mur ligase family protein [Bacteroidota bacterium]